MTVERPEPKNDLSAAVPKFCLALEQFRRLPEGRVRSPEDFQGHFFALEDDKPKDEIFLHLPNEVRAPILNQWGIRGLKAALRDTDQKVQSVVFDALVAGDIDHNALEEGLVPEVVIGWVPLTSFWTFWRGGKLTKKALLMAFETAYELGLFDARWFLETLEARGGKVRGTEVISEGLSKADLSEWIKKIHHSSDGTPKGILGALGWEKLIQQTSDGALVGVLDAMAKKAGLATATPEASAVAEAIASALAGADLHVDSAQTDAGLGLGDGLGDFGAEEARASVPIPLTENRPEPGAGLHDEDDAPSPPTTINPPGSSPSPTHPPEGGKGDAPSAPGSSKRLDQPASGSGPRTEVAAKSSTMLGDAPELSVFETEGLSDDNIALDLEEEGLLLRSAKTGRPSAPPPPEADDSTAVISMNEIPGLRGKRR